MSKLPLPLHHALRTVRNRARTLQLRLQGKQCVHFFHIGKTGGTAIRHALEGHLVTARYVIRLHPHGERLRSVPAGERVVFFVRDPLSRFVSAFYSRMREGRPRYYHPWTPDERAVFTQFETPNQLALALDDPDPARKELALRGMNCIQHVKNGYWELFESEEYFLSRLPDLFFIGFQESLADDFQALKAKLGLPEAMSLPDDEVAAHRSPAHLDRSLEAPAEENLRRWYARDYEFVALCREKRDQVNASR